MYSKKTMGIILIIVGIIALALAIFVTNGSSRIIDFVLGGAAIIGGIVFCILYREGY